MILIIQQDCVADELNTTSKNSNFLNLLHFILMKKNRKKEKERYRVQDYLLIIC